MYQMSYYAMSILFVVQILKPCLYTCALKAHNGSTDVLYLLENESQQKIARLPCSSQVGRDRE